MKLRLIKGLSFRYKDICATNDKPEIVCSKTDGDYLLSTGHFSIVDNVSDESNSEEKPLEKMTKNELINYAADNGIDISACDKKEEIINAIKDAEADDKIAQLED